MLTFVVKKFPVPLSTYKLKVSHMFAIIATTEKCFMSFWIPIINVKAVEYYFSN